MKNIICSILILICLFNFGIQAQWVQTNGPGGGTITALIYKGSDLFAGTIGGIYFSSDNGENWEQVNNGLPADDFPANNFTITSFAASGDNVYAGINGFRRNGIYLTTNNGANWNKISGGLPTDAYGEYPKIVSLTVNGTNLFAGTDTSGIYLSSDNGKNWITANNGLPPKASINAFAVSGNRIFAGTDSGVYLSENNGKDWLSINNGILPSFVDPVITSLVISGDYIFAGSKYEGMYLSTDNGLSWNHVYKGLTSGVINCLAAGGNNIFAGTPFNLGVFISTDSGQNWNNCNLHENVYCLAVNENILVAGTMFGIYRSADNGLNWSPVNTGLPHTTWITALASIGNSIFASTFAGGVFLSTDDGLSWNKANNGMADRNGSWDDISTYSLAVSGNNIFANSSPGGVFLSSNNAAAWSQIKTGFQASVSSLTADGDNIFAGTDSKGIFLSTNNGSDWNQISGDTLRYINTIAVNGNNIFAGTGCDCVTKANGNLNSEPDFSGHIYFSTDNGAIWKEAARSVLNGKVVFSIAMNGGNIFAGAGGVVRSADNGLTWNYNYVDGYIRSILISGKYIFAGGKGVYLSTDNGTTWVPVSSGLADGISVTSLVISGNNIYAGSSKNGIWRRPLSELITGVKGKPENLPDRFSLKQNYPNPFNPTTTINYVIGTEQISSIPAMQNRNAGGVTVTLKVYDILGKEVAVLVNEEKKPGYYQVNFNAGSAVGGLSSGIYFYRLQAGAFTETKKLILLR